MSRRAAWLLAALLLAAPLRAAEPVAKVSGPSRGEVGQQLLYDLGQCVTDDELQVQLVGPGSAEVLYGKDRKPRLALVVATQPGDFFLAVVAAGVKDGESKTSFAFAFWKLAVGALPPPPIPPAPPPVPPGPAPTPPPIPVAGLRVLVVYESGDLSKLPPAQLGALYSKSLRDVLNARCAAGPDGKTKEWRIYDADVDLSAESDVWKAAMARPRKSLPWLVISNGSAGYEGPLPASADETIRLVQQYAGGG